MHAPRTSNPSARAAHVARMALLASLALLSITGAHAVKGGKVYAKVGDWEIRRFPKYCVATIGFDGDRALRMHAGTGGSSFGFMGPGTGAGAKKVPVTYWFGNDKKNKFTRNAVARADDAEDGGAPWLVFADPPNEPSHAANFAMDPSVTFTYKADGQTQSETFPLKGAEKALDKMWQCSGV